jgi:hypothetical protein
MSVSNTSTLKGLIFSFSTLNRTDIRKVKKIWEATIDNKKGAIFSDEDYKKYYPDKN